MLVVIVGVLVQNALAMELWKEYWKIFEKAAVKRN